MGQSGRREFLAAAGALMVTRASIAQVPTKVRRIGILFNGAPTDPGPQRAQREFYAHLIRAGYEEGRNLLIEKRYAEGRRERFPELARDLVRLEVEVIVANSNSATFAAKAATSTIPIVAVMGKPVEYGLIQSHARPGGNVTGTDWVPTIALEQKCFQILKDAVPAAKRAAGLWFTGALSAVYGDEHIRGISASTGFSITQVDIARGEQLAQALETIAASRAEVLYVYGHEFFFPFQARIAAFALQRKIVSICELESYLNAGGMLFYGASSSVMLSRIASLIDRILRGANPGDLPVEQPTHYELVLNRKIALAAGVSFPQSFLVGVDRVIE